MMRGKEGGGGEALSRQAASDPTQGDRQSYIIHIRREAEMSTSAIGLGWMPACHWSRLDRRVRSIRGCFGDACSVSPPLSLPIPPHAKNEESAGGFSFTIAYPTRT